MVGGLVGDVLEKLRLPVVGGVLAQSDVSLDDQHIIRVQVFLEAGADAVVAAKFAAVGGVGIGKRAFGQEVLAEAELVELEGSFVIEITKVELRFFVVEIVVRAAAEVFGKAAPVKVVEAILPPKLKYWLPLENPKSPLS